MNLDALDTFLLKWEKFTGKLVRLIFWPNMLFMVFVAGVMIGAEDTEKLKHIIGGIIALIFLRIMSPKS